MLFNNLAFFSPGLAFFQTWFGFFSQEMSGNPVLAIWSRGKWPDNCQLESLLCCIWFFFWSTYTKLYVEIFRPLVMYISKSRQAFTLKIFGPV